MGDATTCSEDGCMNKPARQGRGYCHKHYLAKLTDGSLPHLKKSQFESTRPVRCAVAACDVKPEVKGYCRPHYARWHKYGDPIRVVEFQGRSICTEEGCRQVVRVNGLCGTHAYRLRKFGSTAPPERKPTMERYRESIDVTAGPDGCHIWTGNSDIDGYGIFFAEKRSHRATRWILGQNRGVPLASDEWALHHCDNPPCVNLKHLYIGDAAQNAGDRERRGRGGAASRGVPTHCRNKHEYTPDNVYLESGKRQCRTCRSARLARKYEKARERRAAA